LVVFDPVNVAEGLLLEAEVTVLLVGATSVLVCLLLFESPPKACQDRLVVAEVLLAVWDSLGFCSE
jgi:hypothetical protein